MTASMGRRRAAILSASVMIAAAIGCSASGDDLAQAGSEAAAAPGAVLTRGDFQRELLLTGELEAVNSIAIKAPQTNIFQMRIQFMAEEGTEVEPGDPLLDFDNSSLASQVRELETRILDAETQIVSKRNELSSALKDLEIEVAEKEYEYERTKVEAAIDPEVMSRKDYSERQLAYSKATRELEETRKRIEMTREKGQAELDVLVIDRDKLKKDLLSAQNHLELLSIKAPARGLVVYEKRQGTTLRYQEGDSCWPGQGVLRLPDLSEMQVVFNVSEVDAPMLKVGLPIEVTLDAFPGRQLTGEILQIPSMAVKRDEESKIAVFKVVASLPETWVGEMKPGMSVLGRIVIEKVPDAPLVAREAVEFDGTRYRLRTAPGQPEIFIEPLSRNAHYYLLSEQEHARLAGGASPEAS